MSVRLMRPGENSEVVAMMRSLWPEAGEYDFSEERGVHVKDAAFQEMVTSVRQTGRIRRGRLRAGRTIVIRPADVQAVRAKLGASRAEFALMIGVSLPNPGVAASLGEEESQGRGRGSSREARGGLTALAASGGA